jgi:hypothetical protein
MQSNEWIVEGMVELRRGGVLRIEDGRGMLVYLWDGSVWLTQDGEGRDVMLGAGGWFRIGREGVTLVYALADCKITLTSPDASRPAAAVQALQPGACQPRTLYQAQPTAARAIVGRVRAAARKGWHALFAPAPDFTAPAT